MAFITVILSLVFERYLGGLREFRKYRWFERFTDRLRELIPELTQRPLLTVILLLLLPLVAVVVAYAILDGIWVVFGFAFALALLLYAYGSQDLEAQMAAFIDARLRGDDEAARWHLSATLRGEIPEDSRQLTRVLMETVFLELNDRLFAVIFWFALLGPAGGLGFRLVSLLKSRFRDDTGGLGSAAGRVYHVLAWLPARITAFSYALAGSFVEAMQCRREEAHKWADENQGILVASGFGALQYSFADDAVRTRESEIGDLRAALALVRRSTFVWLAALAMVGLLGAVVGL